MPDKQTTTNWHTAQGQIPDTLGPLAAEVTSREKVRPLQADELKQYHDIVDLVVKAAAVDPPVTDNGGDKALAITEIEWPDKVAIFSWANGGASALRPFRGKSTRVVKAA